MMPDPSRETYFEPYLHLVDVTPEAALIAWGGFFFGAEGADSGIAATIVEDHQASGPEQFAGLARSRGLNTPVVTGRRRVTRSPRQPVAVAQGNRRRAGRPRVVRHFGR
jgi:hypothetical protein